ncbi:DUF1624 domain-containing protein [Desulfocurvibacter africanus]|uniref:DUF1624 domain-containing protein n=1 Tax=Desulfocurvibacter africanus TaxID=873 RepID=UPI00041170AD|nr:heparan-alpha-glucosaminide N-acetyltransferase domain-containing protein [Desulfocurvibacter africanus]
MDRETAQHVPLGRLAALDLGRGLIMLLMALDHANSMAGLGTQRGGEFWGGQFPDYASLPAFLTRAVSHMCAPGFALLMGAGMALLAGHRHGTGGTSSAFGRFALRGALLIALQFTLENWAWRLGAGFPYGGGIYVGVLAMLGACMLLTGPLARMNAGALLTLALAAMGLGWLLLPPFAHWGEPVPLWLRLLAVPGRDNGIIVLYPLLPWLGIVLAGIAMGRALQRDAGAMQSRLPLIGLGLLLLFALMRAWGGVPANLRPLPDDHLWSFLYAVKYPPSPAFLCLTLGEFLLVLGLLHRVSARAGHASLRLLQAVGRSALPFYILHLWLYALLGWIVAPGVGLAGVYLVWLAGLAPLLPACLAWSRFRASRPDGSAWRLL